MEKPQNGDLFERIKDKYAGMSKSHKKIARFLSTHYERAASLSVVQIAKEVGISEATVVRFALLLEFEGYADFRRALKDQVISKLTTIDRLNLIFEDEPKALSGKQAVFGCLKNDLNALRESIDALDYDVLEKCVSLLTGARRVIILGFRSVSFITEYMRYYLSLILDDVRVLNQSSLDFYGSIVKVCEADVVIAISFPRYSKRSVEALELLREKKPKIITITDNENAPLNRFADVRLTAKSNSFAFVDSLVAPMGIINALIVGVAGSNLDKTMQTFEALERVWKQDDVYTGVSLEEPALAVPAIEASALEKSALKKLVLKTADLKGESK